MIRRKLIGCLRDVPPAVVLRRCALSAMATCTSANGVHPQMDRRHQIIQDARMELAACYRILHKLQFNEGIDNHLTLMVPADPDAADKPQNAFLVIPYGLMWAEVTAQNLLLVDEDGNVVEGEGKPDDTAFWIHSRLHLAHPKAKCILHCHMPYITTICCLAPMELKMISQNAARFANDIAYDHVFNGLVLDRAEGDRLGNAMGSKRIMLHQNHGVMVCADSVAEAFDDLYYLERAAEVQVKAMSTNSPLAYLRPDVIESSKEIFAKDRARTAKLHFDAHIRMLLRDESKKI